MTSKDILNLLHIEEATDLDVIQCDSKTYSFDDILKISSQMMAVGFSLKDKQLCIEIGSDIAIYYIKSLGGE